MPHTAQIMSLPTPTVQDNSITPPQSPIGRITYQTKWHSLPPAGTPSTRDLTDVDTLGKSLALGDVNWPRAHFLLCSNLYWDYPSTWDDPYPRDYSTWQSLPQGPQYMRQSLLRDYSTWDNPYPRDLSTWDNPYPRDYSTWDNPYPRDLSTWDNPYPRDYSTWDNPYPRDYSTWDNPYPRDLSTWDNPYPRDYSTWDNPYPGTTVLETIPTQGLQYLRQSLPQGPQYLRQSLPRDSDSTWDNPYPGTTELVVGPDAYNSTCQNAPTRATKTIGDLEVSDFTLSNAEINAFGSINRQWFLAYIGSQLC